MQTLKTTRSVQPLYLYMAAVKFAELLPNNDSRSADDKVSCRVLPSKSPCWMNTALRQTTTFLMAVALLWFDLQDDYLWGVMSLRLSPSVQLSHWFIQQIKLCKLLESQFLLMKSECIADRFFEGRWKRKALKKLKVNSILSKAVAHRPHLSYLFVIKFKSN